MAARKKPSESEINKHPRERYMRAYGVDAMTISRWIKRGFDLDDAKGVFAQVTAQKRRADGMRSLRDCLAILNGDELERTDQLLAELDKDNQAERGSKVFWEIENLREKNATLKKERELLEGSMVLRADVVQWMNETLEVVRSSFGETSIAFAEANSGKDVPQLLAAIKRRDEDSFMAARNHLLNLTES